MDVTLGVKGRDKITGFQGIVVARVDYLFGCTQFGLAPQVKDDGKIADTSYFDEGRIEYVDAGIAAHEVRGTSDGPDRNRDAPVR